MSVWDVDDVGFVEVVDFAGVRGSGCSAAVNEVVGFAVGHEFGCSAVGIDEVGDSAEVHEMGCSVVDSDGAHVTGDSAVEIGDASEAVDVAEVLGPDVSEGISSQDRTARFHYMPGMQQIAVCPASDSRSEACLLLSKYVLLLLLLLCASRA